MLQQVFEVLQDVGLKEDFAVNSDKIREKNEKKNKHTMNLCTYIHGYGG